MSAEVPFAGTAQAFAMTGLSPLFVNDTLPPGPIATSASFTNRVAFSVSYNGNAQTIASWMPISATGAAVAFEVTARGTASLGSSGPVATLFVSSVMDATVDFMLAASSPASGRMVLQHDGLVSPAPSPSLTTVSVDVHADDLLDLVAVATHGGPSRVELPVSMTSAGTVVRVRFQPSGSALAMPHSFGVQYDSRVTVQVLFFPDEPVVTPFDDTGASAVLTADHTLSNDLTLSLDYLSQQAPGLLVFGTQPVSIPILPTVTQLVAIDTWFPVTTATFALPLLPPGIEVYCQGLVADSTGTLRSSNSIRAIWP